ncbi:hypothetical protein ACFL5T_03075 [Gemmatimonadota bacterium]
MTDGDTEEEAAHMFKDRLKEALDARDYSVAEFQRRLAAERENAFDLTGSPEWLDVPTSLATIFRYLNGDSEPGASWLNFASAVLEVELEWLVIGRGPRTPEEAAGLERSTALDIAFLQGAEYARSASDPAVVASLRALFGRLLASLPDGAFGVTPEQAKNLAMMIETAMLEPMRAVAPGRKGHRTTIVQDPERWRTYTTLVILAMDVAMRPPGENVSADELLRRWSLYRKFDAEARSEYDKLRTDLDPVLDGDQEIDEEDERDDLTDLAH